VPVTKTGKEGSLLTNETEICVCVCVKKGLRTYRCTIQECIWSDWQIPHQP